VSVPATTSIVIPTYNYAQWLPDAIASALSQTVAYEVVIIDDGSTDQTSAVLDQYLGESRVRVVQIPHSGPSVARNAGIDAATGEFLMFLDADDVIAPTKVEAQLTEFAENPDAGWVLCDVRIEDEAKGRITTASEQYRYGDLELSGWIQAKLTAGNFIPIMSPLIRRSVLGDTIRFNDRLVPEDWHFWHAVAGIARVRYVPQVLATYRHRRTGRSRLPKKARAVSPNVTLPLRLNLGCGQPNTRSWHPMPGLVNLDKSLGWRFEDGLGDFIDHSVAGITVSHALMYVPESEWPAVFREFARVLIDGGVVRITEDETADPRSKRHGGWQGSQPAVTLTTPALVKAHLERAGLVVYEVTKATTKYADRSLCQAQHGDPPDVFFVEGMKLPGVVFAPHSDDETLFAAFTILRYRPRVVVCFPSWGDYGESAVREAETRDAMSVLGAGPVEHWAAKHTHDLLERMREFEAERHPARVWAPHRHASHPDHVAVAAAALEVFGDRVIPYHTYVNGSKVRGTELVPFEPIWIQQKLRALARYESQIRHPRAHQFFVQDLLEYQGEVAS
jgi:glycosyltransferase involved in cell wall biosynthesis/LmbE family N-acetylglucosaminyl deacetylase